jgi:hypothetical protein
MVYLIVLLLFSFDVALLPLLSDNRRRPRLPSLILRSLIRLILTIVLKLLLLLLVLSDFHPNTTGG